MFGATIVPLAVEPLSITQIGTLIYTWVTKGGISATWDRVLPLLLCFIDH
jgi:hypothetical protein